MRKKRVIIYGCGFFFESHKYEVENEYNIVATVDKNNLNSKYKDIKNVDEEYDYLLIMLEKINILFEVLNEIINVKEVDNKKIIFGIEKYGFLKDTAKIQIEDNGIIIFYTENKRIIVSDEQSFYEYLKKYAIPCLEKKSNFLEKQLEDIHKNIYDMTWASGSSLSYNHDNDLFYRLPKYGCFDFGLTASLSLRCINNFINPYVLDLGCADGFYFKRFYSYLDNIRYVGCDKDTYSINKAKQLFSKEKRCSFLECDFIENMPLPCDKDYFTNVLWYASMQMFNTNDQRIILHNIKKRIGKEGILCGSAIIKENSWEYCINYFNGINSLKELLEEFFENVVVYSDFGMGDYAVFIASQSKLQIRNEIY